ncbi:MAG: hypothetical protein ACFB4I_23240 [Cyanophyceae cyanobacterium]
MLINLRDLYNNVFDELQAAGYLPRKQNVSVGIKVNSYDVDIIPAKRQSQHGNDHILYRRKANTWTKTNISLHISLVRNSNRTNEIRLIKLWRDQKGINFPSFYLELVTIKVLSHASCSNIADNVLKVFSYLKNYFVDSYFVDPANSNNVISDDISISEKNTIVREARKALSANNWNQIIK